VRGGSAASKAVRCASSFVTTSAFLSLSLHPQLEFLFQKRLSALGVIPAMGQSTTDDEGKVSGSVRVRVRRDQRTQRHPPKLSVGRIQTHGSPALLAAHRGPPSLARATVADAPCQAPGLSWSTIAVRVRAQFGPLCVSVTARCASGDSTAHSPLGTTRAWALSRQSVNLFVRRTSKEGTLEQIYACPWMLFGVVHTRAGNLYNAQQDRRRRFRCLKVSLHVGDLRCYGVERYRRCPRKGGIGAGDKCIRDSRRSRSVALLAEPELTSPGHDRAPYTTVHTSKSVMQTQSQRLAGRCHVLGRVLFQ
jgi:hypothetical protein